MHASTYPDNILYHQYLKGDTCSLNDDDVDYPSIRSYPSICQASPSLPQQPCFRWDLRATCKPMIPAFHYISQQLTHHGLQIALIISHHGPCVIPIWPLPQKSQIILTRILRKACARYERHTPNWMTALASISSKKDLPAIFEAYKPDAYIIRRSIVQNEIIFSAKGLTLLSIDHIYTLKQLLCTLSKKDWVSYSRQVCLSSCVHLLHRINTIHNRTKFSKAYIARVYQDTPLQEETLDLVMAEYDANFCTASIRNISSELDFSTFYDEKLVQDSVDGTAELADDPTSCSETLNELVSPLADVDLSTVYSWESETPDTDPISPLAVTYPPIRGPYNPPPIEREAEIWYRSVSASPTDTIESWGPDAPPSPLRVVKRASTHLTPELDSFKEVHNFAPKSQEDKEDDNAWRMDILDATSKEIVDAWNQAVPDIIQAPRRPPEIEYEDLHWANSRSRTFEGIGAAMGKRISVPHHPKKKLQEAKKKRKRRRMRPLTEQETKTVFEKLANYTGRSLTNLIAPPPSTTSDGSSTNPPTNTTSSSSSTSGRGRHVFRLHMSRVYYLPLQLANLATSIARPNLLSLGTCIGKFSKTGKFRMHITALDVIAPHARYKLWVKANGEMPFLYGGNVVKAHVGKWSEDCPAHQGVVVLGMDDTPLVC
ncbi:MAG: hypothetical protein Q9217_000869 [Psora testacea]